MYRNWMQIIFIEIACLLIVDGKDAMAAKASVTNSPDGKLSVIFQLNDKGQPLYSIQFNGKDVLKPSSLGLIRDEKSFAEGLTVENISGPERIEDNYTMLLGKRRKCSYIANHRVFNLKNSEGEKMQIIFQVSNDGAAFRYAFPEKSEKTYSIKEEKTTFVFEPNTVSWLHPMQPGKSGWSRTQPSYEEHYEIEKKVVVPSPTGEGWCLPALFKTSDNIWILICDSDVDESYCAVRLGHDSAGGVYKVAFPHPEEHRGKIDPVQPTIAAPFKSPWRVLVIGDKLKTIVESTLITDVASPSKYKDTDFIKPGRAAWHWLRYDDNSSTLEVADSFLEFAAKMKWEYMLIDANWDRFIGYEKMADFVKKAASKNVGVILWYNPMVHGMMPRWDLKTRCMSGRFAGRNSRR